MVGLRAQLRDSRFSALAKQVKEQKRAARVRATMVGASVAKQLAPVDTGYLRSLIAVQLGPYGGVKLVSGADYSAHVNFGTVFKAPVPFFTKGVETMKKQLPKEYARIRLR